MQEIHLVIKGRVQRVFYRSKACKKAIELGLFGWIKNNDDGTVELVARGPTEKLEEFIEWCKEGPELAKVKDIQIEKRAATEVNDSFEIKY